MSSYHVPVLLQPVCTLMDIRPGNKYVDATVGGGGHSTAIVERGGMVLGLDQDPDALSACPRLDHLTLVRSNFIHLKEVVEQHHWQPLSGVLFDLGVSWHQLVTPQRGFSFQSVGPLDMRMDPDLPNTAATLVNILSQRQLVQILREYGEEPAVVSISQKIIAARPIDSTDQLARIIPDSQSRRRVFQALRIAVNDELSAVNTALPQAMECLSPGGCLAVISFHSLEDRIVKNHFSQWVKDGNALDLTPIPIVPDQAEISINSHSQSAKLRVISKI